MLRVGIVMKTQAPLTVMECFSKPTVQNGTGLKVLNFLQSVRECRNNPGYSLEIVWALLQYFQIPKDGLRFVGAEGWGASAAGTGLVDFLSKNEIDFSVGQLAYTYKRSQKIRYPLPTLFLNGPCFLLCGTDHFSSISIYGIADRFFGNRSMTLLIVIVFLMLILGRFIEKRKSGTKRESRYLNDVLISFLDTILSSPKERSTVGRLHARWFTALLVIVVLRGSCRAGLLKTFTHERVYPYRTVSEIAEAIKSKNLQLSVLSPSASSYNLISYAEHYSPLRAALKDNPVQFIGNSIERIANSFHEQSNLVYFTVQITVQNFLTTKAKFDCICDPLDAPMSDVHGGIGLRFEDEVLSEKISVGVARLLEVGILKKLERKYRTASQKIIDSNQLREDGLKPGPKRHRLKPSAFAGLFIIYGCSLLPACLCLALERLSRTMLR